jgi:hypothetical protein
MHIAYFTSFGNSKSQYKQLVYWISSSSSSSSLVHINVEKKKKILY